MGRGLDLRGSGLPERRLHRRVYADDEEVQRTHPANLRFERGVAERHGLRERVQWWSVLWVVQPEREAMQRHDDADVRLFRNLAGRTDMLESSVRGGKLHRHVCSRRQTLLGQWRADVCGERAVGNGGSVRFFGVRERRLLGRLRAWRDAVLGQRFSDVYDERSVGCDHGVHEPSVRRRRLHGRV